MTTRLAACLALALGATAWSLPASANPALGELLEEVRQDRARDARQMRALEQDFLQRLDQAEQSLAETRAQREQAEAESIELRQRLAELERALDQQRQELRSESGDLGRLGETTRLLAGELRDRLLRSPTRVQRPGRQAELEDLAESAGLPRPQQLQFLWETLLDDISLGGTIDRFDHLVTGADGREQVRPVVRVGTLHLLSQGDYLQFLPASGSLLASPRQPPAAVRALATRFQAGESERLAVDPSQGQALRLAASGRDWRERLAQGGLVGYAILALAAVAGLISLERLLVLALLGRRLQRQRQGQPTAANPLSRLQAVHAASNGVDTETLGLKLDEAVLRELPAIRRGLSTLSVLGAAAPLLGLLGTVAGMIQTFQVISVFGNGDPKLLSGGISQALVTTELGLLAAIPILLLHSFLNARSNQLVQVLDEESAALLAGFAERGGAEAPGGAARA